MKSMKDENGSNSNNNWLGFSLSGSANSCLDPHNHHHLSSTYLPYGAVAENGTHFQSPISVMPLKSDGSLCIMEALSSSHSQVVVSSTSSPKLEDFLGGAIMASDSMVVSLDGSTLYNQEPFNHPHQQQHNYYSIPQTNEIPCFKTWIDNHQHALEQVNNNNNNHKDNNNGDLQSLSLSMSPVSQSSCVTAATQISPTQSQCVPVPGPGPVQNYKKRGADKMGQKLTVHRKSIDTFGQRTSQYRGVTRHRWTGRYEAHLWDNSCKKEGQTRKGRQVYLGGYDMEEKAARAYDLAALKYWGPSTHINFALENYHQELEEMKNMTRQEYVAHLRRKSSGFSRGASIYRGVTRHHQHGRWQARIGRVAGNKDLYLGTFSTQEEAAEAYDIAAIKFRGSNAVTNFDISRYDVEKIMASNTLPAGETARRSKGEKPCNVAAAAAPDQVENVDVGSWKMVLNNNDNNQEVSVAIGSQTVKALNVGNYANIPFSVALHDLIGLESGQNVVDQSGTTTSLVTSLSSSGETSPVQFGKPNIGSWIPTGQLRPVQVPLTAPQLPVFAAWNDV